jgi:hypothetical protein
MQNEQRNQRMMMSNPMNAQYQNVNMMRANMPNGVPNDLKRAALQNNRPYVDRAALTSRPVLSSTPHCTPLTCPPATATPWPTWAR